MADDRDTDDVDLPEHFGRTMRDEWIAHAEGMLAHLMPDQLTVAKRLYFSGARTLMQLIGHVDEATEGDDDTGRRWLAIIHRDIEDYADRVAKGLE